MYVNEDILSNFILVVIGTYTEHLHTAFPYQNLLKNIIFKTTIKEIDEERRVGRGYIRVYPEGLRGSYLAF